MKNELMKLDTPELQGIEKSKSEQIKNTFAPMAVMLSEFEEAFFNVLSEAEIEITKEVTLKAKRLRLDIGKIRIDTEKVRKEQKEEYLRAGKAIDGVSNILKWAVTDKENKLKEIEDYFDIQEQKRLDELQKSREIAISPYLEDAHLRKLCDMEQDIWEAYLSTKKKDHEDVIAANKKAEEDRIAKEKADAEERERIRLENIKLIKEIKAIEAKAEQERIKREAEEKARNETARKEREAYELKLKAERDEKEKIQKAIEAKAEQERIKAKEEAAKIQSELNKGDAAKVTDLINDLTALKTKYSFKAEKNKKIYFDTGLLIDKIILFIQK